MQRLEDLNCNDLCQLWIEIHLNEIVDFVGFVFVNMLLGDINVSIQYFKTCLILPFFRGVYHCKGMNPGAGTEFSRLKFSAWLFSAVLLIEYFQISWGSKWVAKYFVLSFQAIGLPLFKRSL